jgi:hypothetical protein
MSALHRRLLLALAMPLLAVEDARPQGLLQGAWIEEGTPCSDVFVATRGGVAFKRPANAFAPAFIVSGRRLTTPLATCTLIGRSSGGERELVRLSCTTAVATDTARAIFSPATDGGMYRYHSLEGGIATRYQRCSRDALKAP